MPIVLTPATPDLQGVVKLESTTVQRPVPPTAPHPEKR
jgi:hypothetical protein